MKKVHKISRYNSYVFGWVVRPECRVDNKTYAYEKSTKWQNTTCKRCLAKKEKLNAVTTNETN